MATATALALLDEMNRLSREITTATEGEFHLSLPSREKAAWMARTHLKIRLLDRCWQVLSQESQKE